MTYEYCGGEKKEWEIEGLCKFYRACPKDPFPVPEINQLVDATYGYPRMSFLDAFQGYHWIVLATEDQEKTAFISPDANYHYTMMPFGLKNAGATYQWMM